MSAPWPFRQDEWDALKAAEAQIALVDTQRQFAASQADLTRAERENDRLRTGLAAAVAELRRLALANRRDACGLAQPYVWGPTRAAQAYERAVAIVEQACGLSNSDENRG